MSFRNGQQPGVVAEAEDYEEVDYEDDEEYDEEDDEELDEDEEEEEDEDFDGQIEEGLLFRYIACLASSDCVGPAKTSPQTACSPALVATAVEEDSEDEPAPFIPARAQAARTGAVFLLNTSKTRC